MSNLILPQKWTRQPQVPVEIDWSNPFGARIEYYFTPDFQGGRRRSSPSTPSGGVTRVSGKYGIGLKGNGSSGYVAGPPDIPIAGQGALTRFAVLRIGSGGSTRAILSSGGSGGAMWRVANNTDLVWVKTNLNVEFTQAGILSAGEYCILVSVNNPVANAFYTYKNGVLVATTAALSTSNGGVASVGQSGTGSSFGDHELYLVGSLTGALSASEAREFTSNPWQIFKPQSRRIWVGAAGGTNTAVNPGTGSIAITGYAPSIAQTANQAITPNVGNIVITGYAPTISQPQAVNPGVGSLTITGYAPTVTQNVDTPVNPGVGTIAITGYAPAVSQTANQLITPDVGNIAITGYSPTVSQSANQAVTPDVGTITITGYAPIVQQAPASQNITPDVGTITITGYAPTVEQSSPLRLGGFEYGSKVYIKRNKKIYIFDSVEEADSYLEAEAKVEEIVQQSNRTSRLARKRAREKAFKSLAIEPVDTVDIPALKTLVAQLQTDFELPKLIAQQDWQRVVEIYNQAMEMQDEEDLLLIL